MLEGVQCHRCDQPSLGTVCGSWGNGSAIASSVAPRSGSATVSTAAGACAYGARSRPRRDARAADRTACWWLKLGDVCGARGGAANVVGRSGSVARSCAGRARSTPNWPTRGRRARAAASPAICGSRPVGADLVRARAHRRIRRGSAHTAASCDAMPGAACAGDAGSATRTAHSCAVRPWLPGSSSLRTGSTISWPIWLLASVRPARVY